MSCYVYVKYSFVDICSDLIIADISSSKKREPEADEIIKAEIVVTPYRRYLKVARWDQDLFLDWPPSFKHQPRNTGTIQSYYYDLTPGLQKYLFNIRTLVVTEVTEPRFHETKWQETNGIIKC